MIPAPYISEVLPRRDRAIRSILTSYLSFAVNIFVTILITPFLLSYLGQSGYGLWATLGSLLGYLALLDLGLSYASARFVAEYQAINDVKGLNEFTGTVFVAYLILGGVVFGISVLVSFYVSDFFHLSSELAIAGQIFFLIAGGNLALALPLSPLSSILIGQQRLDALNLINIVGSVCNGFFSVLVLRVGLGLVGVAWVGLGINLFAAALKWFFIRKQFPQIRLRPDLFNAGMLKKALGFSVYVFIINIGVQIVFNTDNIIISEFLGVAAVAAYAIAFRLTFMAMQLIFKVADALFPLFSELHALKEKNKLKAAYLETARLSVAMAIPITIVLVLFGERIIRIWVGAENFVGMPVLWAFGLLTLMHSFIHPGAVMLSSIGKIQTMTYCNIAEAVLNLAFSLALVKPIGVLGVALGTVIAQALTTLWYIPGSAAREVGLSLSSYIREVFLRPMLVGLPAFVLVTLLNRFLPDPDEVMVISFCLAIFLFYGLCFLIFVATEEERSFYKQGIRTLMRI